ncbi:hypothetical protein Tco_0839080 [Tanacetum coccineum]|uniref:Retroviral polymerase SH3-like domain-containing protein n=1 Tax=Tanacetum coccineum TaxID=301880 RepID=A0ABQ5ATL4_9ASTR
MPKSNNEKKDNKSLKRTARISVRACCFINPPPTSLPYQRFSPPSDYQSAPPSTPLESPPTTPIAPPEFSPGQLLTTLKTTLPPLTSPPLAPTQPSKQSSSLAINIKPIELIFSTPPTSPRPFFYSLEDLPPRTINPPPPLPMFDTIERLASQPSSVPYVMEPTLPPLPPQLPPHSQPMCCKAVVRLLDPKLKTLGERDIECIFVGYAEHSKAFRLYVIKPNKSVSINSIIESRDDIFDENRFSSVPRPSVRIFNETKDISGSVVLKEVTKEVVAQQHEPERTRDEVTNQHSYCFNVEDDPKTFKEAMKSHDVAF